MISCEGEEIIAKVKRIMSENHRLTELCTERSQRCDELLELVAILSINTDVKALINKRRITPAQIITIAKAKEGIIA